MMPPPKLLLVFAFLSFLWDNCSAQCTTHHTGLYAPPSGYGSVSQYLTDTSPRIIKGKNSRTGTIKFVNEASTGTTDMKVCQVELYGERTGSRIKIEFTEFSTGNKMYIVDGFGPTMGKVTTYTSSRGGGIPSAFNSETNSVGILFFSDSAVGSGAKMKYTMTEGSGKRVELDSDGVLQEQEDGFFDGLFDFF